MSRRRARPARGRKMKGRILITGGEVLPCDGRSQQPHEALVLEDGKVAGYGSKEDMARLAGPRAQHMNANGATVLPGFVDTHPHVMHLSAPFRWMVDLRDAVNHDDIVARIRKRARVTPPGQWIVCTPVGEPFYFLRRSHHDLEERRLPDRWVLDAATDRHPVFIAAFSPKMPNIVAFNSKGLEAVGIGDSIPDRVGNVWIEKDDDTGVPTGVLHGHVLDYLNPDPFWNQIRRKLPQPPDGFWIDGVRYGQPIYHRLGVTSIYEAHLMAPDHIRAYEELRDNGELRLRVGTAMELSSRPLFTQADEPASTSQVQESLRTGLELTRSIPADDLLRVQGISISRSGSTSAGYTRCYHLYETTYGEPTFGKPLEPRWVEEEAIRFCLEHNLKLHLILLTPKDHDDFFKSFAPFEGKYDIGRRGWLIEHSPLITPAQVKKYAKLGLRFTMSTSFTWGKADVWRRRMGEEILRDFNPLKRMFDAGIPVGNGTDWGPHNIFEHLKFSETHEMIQTGRCNNGPDQVLSREQALAMWTREAARALNWKGVGTLARGNHADAIFVDRNPLTTPLDNLPKTKVLRTLLGGEVVYDSGDL